MISAVMLIILKTSWQLCTEFLGPLLLVTSYSPMRVPPSFWGQTRLGTFRVACYREELSILKLSMYVDCLNVFLVGLPSLLHLGPFSGSSLLTYLEVLSIYSLFEYVHISFCSEKLSCFSVLWLSFLVIHVWFLFLKSSFPKLTYKKP